MNKLIKLEEKILAVLTEIFIGIIIIIYPLIVNSTGFFRILECKWYAFLLISSIYLSICTIVVLYFLIVKKINYIKRLKFNIIQISVLIFLLINILSCFLSPFFSKYNLFIGVGRGEGLIMMSLYSLSFLFISLFGKLKKRYILYFSISSILISFICILQYIGFNPFNMYQGEIGTHNVSFMGTIGNIDFISAIYTILLSISFTSFIFLDDNKKTKIIHLLSVMMGSFIFLIINVDSGKVAFGACLLILIPFIFTNNKYLSRFLILISSILFSYALNVIINPEYHYDLRSLNLYFQFNYIVILYLFVIILLLFLSKILKNIKYDFTNNKKTIKNFYVVIIFFIIFGFGVLYFYDFKSGMLYQMHELLHLNFKDEFGTYRIFLWKRTLSIVNEFPILGSGPDTFAVRFMAKFTNDIKMIGPLTINDTASNVYLTMLINIGILGLLSYLFFIFVQIKNVFKKNNKYSYVIVIGMICYLISDFFNLSVVICTPIFWTLMSIVYLASTSSNIVDKNEKKK